MVKSISCKEFGLENNTRYGPDGDVRNPLARVHVHVHIEFLGEISTIEARTIIGLDESLSCIVFL